MWDAYLKGFKAYLQLERSMSDNTIEAYLHDVSLLADFITATYGIDLNEVIIYKLEEGIFFAKLICQNGSESIEIDSRTSDALALAVRANCRIYTYENILEAAGLYLDQTDEPAGVETAATGTAAATSKIESDTDLKNLSLDELNKLLQKVLEQEDYVRAINIRDEINSRKSK